MLSIESDVRRHCLLLRFSPVSVGSRYGVFACKETVQPYRLPARQLRPEEQPFSSLCVNEISSRALSETYRRGSRRGTAICLSQAAPRVQPSPSPPRDHDPGSCPSAPRGHLRVTSLSQPAALSPGTPACSGAQSNSRGRRGKSGRIWQGWRANFSWVMPCWVSEGCKRGRVLPAAFLSDLEKE